MLEYFYFERLKYSSGVKWIIFYDLLLIFFFFETLICNRGQTYRAKKLQQWIDRISWLWISLFE